MDDESYFTLSNSTLAGNDTFYAVDPNECSDEVRYIEKRKFEPKLLVSICISPRGLSPERDNTLAKKEEDLDQLVSNLKSEKDKNEKLLGLFSKFLIFIKVVCLS